MERWGAGRGGEWGWRGAVLHQEEVTLAHLLFISPNLTFDTHCIHSPPPYVWHNHPTFSAICPTARMASRARSTSTSFTYCSTAQQAQQV